jgi:hypothetical protein
MGYLPALDANFPQLTEGYGQMVRGNQAFLNSLSSDYNERRWTLESNYCNEVEVEMVNMRTYTYLLLALCYALV